MKIFLDLDGVLADFHIAACELHGRPGYVPLHWEFYKDWGMTDDEFWRPIRELGTDFYEHRVPRAPWALDIVEAVREVDPDFQIVTVAGAGNPDDYAGKVIWVKKWLGSNIPVWVVPGSKYLLASRGRVLIDDSDTNCLDFAAAGGNSILFPQPWNGASPLTDDRAEFVKQFIKVLRRKHEYQAV